MLKKVAMLLTLLCLSTPALAAQDDELLQKIKLLEQQIQELKLLKEQQRIGVAKQEQCMKAFGREKFCSCIGTNLPSEVNFEQYIHTVITPKDQLGYDSMSKEQKSITDATIAVREKCIEKGFFQ